MLPQIPRTTPPVRRARGSATVALALAVLPGLAGTASAHTALAGSTPAADARVDTAPGQVDLVFTEPVSPDLAAVVVTAPDGATLAEGPARVDGDTVTQPLHDPPVPGEYRVAYRVVAADGHPVTGSLTFAVATLPAGSPSPSPSVGAGAPPATPEASPGTAAPEATATGSGGVPWGLLAVALAAVAAAAVVAAGLSRRRSGAG